MHDNVQAPDVKIDDAARSDNQEEEKQTAVAAEVAPGSNHIVAAADVKCLKPIRESYLSIGPDPATDDSGQLRGPSTSATKIEGPT